MPASHKKAMAAIESCRTPALGGQLYYCKKCEAERYSYHSCKNRYCPKCQNGQANEWLERQKQLLLNVPYFLVTFTLPSELRRLARSHQKAVYNIFMRVCAQAMLTLTGNPKYLGGLVGIISVLQTWTRDLRYHPHVHMVVCGAGLSADSNQWLRLRYRYLVPNKALAKLVRGKVRAALGEENLLGSVPSRVWNQPWVIDLRAVGSGFHALRYLAPYVFRVAISNRRIVALQDDNVTFQFKNSKTKQSKIATLPAEQFIARFLQHVLPHRFIKVRTYGLFHPQKKSLLEKAKLLAGTTKEAQPSEERVSGSQYPEVILCPQCKKPMQWIGKLSRQSSGVRSP
jgi:hypothetical protein